MFHFTFFLMFILFLIYILFSNLGLEFSVRSWSYCYMVIMLWVALDINNFYFILFYFSILLFFFFFLKSDEEARDNEVTWQVTWCDITSLEYDERVWKMMSGHMEYIWPWVGHKTGMRMKHGHEGRVNYW